MRRDTGGGAHEPVLGAERPPWLEAVASDRRGVLLDLASHHIDAVAFVFGGAARDVTAVLRSVRTEDDTAVVSLRLHDGLPVSMLMSNSAAREDRIEVYGDSGKLTLDRYEATALQWAPAAPGYRRRDRLAAAEESARTGRTVAVAAVTGADPGRTA